MVSSEQVITEQERILPLPIVSSREALSMVESSKMTETQRRFMELTIRFGSAFWHNFGDGEVCILDVAHFLNHGVDVPLMEGMVSELKEKLGDVNPDVVLTAASGGITVGYEMCTQLGVQTLVYAPKKPTIIQQRNGAFRTDAVSYTGGHGVDLAVAEQLLRPDDKVLWIDDFLDTGRMTSSAYSIVEQAGAKLVGCAYAVDKRYAGGRTVVEQLADQIGLPRDRVVSFIDIQRMDGGVVQFGGFDVGFSLQRQEIIKD